MEKNRQSVIYGLVTHQTTLFVYGRGGFFVVVLLMVNGMMEMSSSDYWMVLQIEGET